MGYSVTFAYNSTPTIPSAGVQRKSVTIAFADDSMIEYISNKRTRIDQSVAEMMRVRERLRFVLGPAVLLDSTNRPFFYSWFAGPHRWAVFGNFNDPANSANANLCKAVLVGSSTVINLGMEEDGAGYVIASELEFVPPISPSMSQF